MEEINLYASLPKKRVAAAALFFNEQSEILIVKPVYREAWLLLGGIVEKNESPRQACIREIEEELGLQVAITRLLCVDYKIPRAALGNGFEFVFLGGTLDRETSERIHLQAEELSEARFVNIETAMSLLNHRSARYLPFVMKALAEETTIYLEGEQEIN